MEKEIKKYNYAQRNIEEIYFEFEKHLVAMTKEGLHLKGAIAAELAFRDHKISQLEQVIKQQNSPDEN